LEQDVSNAVRVTLDDLGDVLYATRGDPVATAKEAPTDSYLILSLDTQGRVVGVQLLAAHEMPPEFWLRHPDRAALPADLLSAIDEWMTRQRG
jgi:hypothetical protein